MGFADVIRLASRYTVARMLERDDFKKRYTGNVPISVHELLYLAQAYDSVALKADVELALPISSSTCSSASAIMPDYQLTPQVALTGPILEGLDAKLDPDPADHRRQDVEVARQLRRRGGGAGGAVRQAHERLGRPHVALLRAALDRTSAEIAALRAGHPKAAKIALAKEIVTRFQGADAAARAEEHFAQVHARREVPDEVEERSVALDGQASLPLARLLADAKVVASGSEARRLIVQGGVSVNGERVSDEKATLGAGDWLVKVGKRRFVRLKLS